MWLKEVHANAFCCEQYRRSSFCCEQYRRFYLLSFLSIVLPKHSRESFFFCCSSPKFLRPVPCVHFRYIFIANSLAVHSFMISLILRGNQCCSVSVISLPYPFLTINALVHCCMQTTIAVSTVVLLEHDITINIT